MLNNRKVIRSKKVDKWLLSFNLVVALIYFSWWFNFDNIDNKILYLLLFFGEFYHFFMAASFWYTIFPNNKKNLKSVDNKLDYFPTVDVFITVAGEPIEIVAETIRAAKEMDYPNFKIYILNDGYVAKKNNWREIEQLAFDLEINNITRKIPGGAKAGNINNGISLTHGELITVFDADMVPHKDFLKKMIPYFENDKVGFVQSPQYYKNFEKNQVTLGAWSQQEFFFGPIMRGKDKSNAAFICGTNFLIRRKTLIEAGGMDENNIAEDFLTSLRVHQLGWQSHYVSEVLCEGLAPEDLLSYYKQQLRWARGSLEVLFSQNPLFKKGLSFRQKLEYLSSALYYFNGLIFLIDIAMPIIFLFTGMKPVSVSSTSFALFFVPFMFLNMYTLRLASGQKITFQALSFSQSSWTLHLEALKSVILKQKTAFSITPKIANSGSFWFLVYPHLFYFFLTLTGIIVGIKREGFDASVMTNIAWALVNCAMFLPFIYAAYNPKTSSQQNIPRLELASGS